MIGRGIVSDAITATGAPASRLRKRPKVDKREKVLAVATELFQQVGVATTSMSDIAKATGIARMTLYRLFSDRSALIEAILHDRFAAIIDLIRAHIASYDRLEEAIVEGADFGLRQAQADALMLQILETESGYAVEAFLLHNTPAIRRLYIEAWQPLFANARQTGELSSALSDERLIEGMRAIVNPLLLRSDLSDADRRMFLQDFLVPALFRR